MSGYDSQPHSHACGKCWKVDNYKYLTQSRQEIVMTVCRVLHKYKIPKYIKFDLIHKIVQTFYPTPAYYSIYFDYLKSPLPPAVTKKFWQLHLELPLACLSVVSDFSTYQGHMSHPCCQTVDYYNKINGNYYCSQHWRLGIHDTMETIRLKK